MAFIELRSGYHIIKNDGDKMWGVYECGKIIAQTRTLFGARLRVKKLLKERGEQHGSNRS